jgi:hypothetical protein
MNSERNEDREKARASRKSGKRTAAGAAVRSGSLPAHAHPPGIWRLGSFLGGSVRPTSLRLSLPRIRC